MVLEDFIELLQIIDNCLYNKYFQVISLATHSRQDRLFVYLEPLFIPAGPRTRCCRYLYFQYFVDIEYQNQSRGGKNLIS